MEITGLKAFPGRNIYSHNPVLRVEVNLREWGQQDSRMLTAFQERLLALLPGLNEHHCSRGKKGGFVERLREGTFLGHIIEHVLLEMQYQLGAEVNYGKTRYLANGRVEIIFEYANKETAVFLAQEGIKSINLLLAGKQADLEKIMARAAEIMAANSPGPSTSSILAAAARRGIPYFFIREGSSLVQLGSGRYAKRLQATLTERTSCLGADLAEDKGAAKELFKSYGIPVPEGTVVKQASQALTAAKLIGYPLVVKPLKGNQGKGVSLNITSRDELIKAFAQAKRYSADVLVERQVFGRHYRLLVVDGKVVAASERIPAYVIGDGKNSINKLVKIENSSPLRGEGHGKPLTSIKLDTTAAAVLARKEYDFESIPPAGEQVFLRDNANLSTGGIAHDVTDCLHQEAVDICLRAVSLLGLDIAGVDLVSPDISLPFAASGGMIIEINAAPGIRMHHYPLAGKPRDAAASIVDYLFPPNKPFEVPLYSVTGTNGKTTTTRLLAHILSLGGEKTACATTDGIYLGGELIVEGDTTGPESAKMLLLHKEAAAIVLETARGGIIRKGLGYDLAHCAVITNISRDHLGQDGLRDLGDIVRVKSLVAEAVRKDGAVVLNAVDPSTPYLAGNAGGETVFFGPAEAPYLKKHLEHGGKALFLKKGNIYWARGNKVFPVAAAAMIPLSFGGKADYNLENAMAAAAACLSQGVPLYQVKKGLESFQPNGFHNPGRGNIYWVKGRYVLVDYGHNPVAVEATARFARKLARGNLLGVLGVPGDRSDDLIRETGLKAGRYFDTVFIKEDKDLRGRPPGQTASLLMQGLRQKNHALNCQIILAETDALLAALQKTKPGDLVVVFYEMLAPLLEIIQQFGQGQVEEVQDFPGQTALVN